MSGKSFVKIALVSGGNILNAVLGFFFLAIVAKTLSLDDFGRYALLTSILLVCAKFIDFGSNSIYVTRFLTQEEDQSVTDTFHTLKILLLVIVSPISIFLVRYFFPDTPALCALFVSGLIAYTLNFTFYAHFQKEEKYATLLLLNTLPALLKTVIGALVIFKVLPLNLVSAFAYFTLSIFMDIFLIPFLPKNARTLKLDFSHLKAFFIKGLPSGFSQLVQEGWPALNNTITKYLRSFSEVGSFALANKISTIFGLLSLSVFTVLLPKNAKLKGQKKPFDIEETILIAIAIFVLALISITGAGFFINFIFGDKFQGSIKVLDALIFASAFSAIHTFVENYFLVENKNNYILLVNIGKLIAFFTAIIFLSKTYGVEGVAYANLIAAITALIITIISIRKTN